MNGPVSAYIYFRPSPPGFGITHHLWRTCL